MRSIFKTAGTGATILLIAAGAMATTEHDNYVDFDLDGVTEFTFTPNATDGYKVTEGQPFDGVTSSVSGEHGWINVKAGRHGSSDVAEWFEQQVGSGATAACDSSGNFPDNLNFAVAGTLTFTVSNGASYTCDDVIIGQGHFTGANNWWVGGPHMQGVHASIGGGVYQNCDQKGTHVTPTEVTFMPETPCSNTFSMSTLTIKP